MDQFQLIRIIPGNVDPGSSKKMELFEKPVPTGPSFMINKSLRDQARLKSIFNDPDTDTLDGFINYGRFLNISRICLLLTTSPDVS